MTSVVRRMKLAVHYECVSGQLTVRQIVLFPYLNANNIAKVTLTSRRLPKSTVLFEGIVSRKKSVITAMVLLGTFLNMFRAK
jgi:hypothetical protein